MVEKLIREARRRVLLNETLAQLAFAAAVTISGFALVLVLGTRYLEWWTLAVFAAAGIGVGVYRVYRRTPGEYATAVRLDENAGLHDTLSTALYFSEHEAGSGEFRRSQREQAENTAGGVQLDRAIPFIIPRSLYAMAALCVLVSALIAVRYRVGHGLDLSAPITQFFFEDQANPDLKKSGALFAKSKPWMQQAQSLLSKLGMAPKPEQPTPGDPDALDKAIEQALQNPANQDGSSSKGGDSGKSGQSKAGEGSGSESKDAQAGDPLDQGEKSGDQNGSDASNPKSADANAKSSSGKGGNPNNNDGLLSRLKDAVSNMLSKANKEDKPGQKNQQSAKNEKSSGEKGQPGDGQQQKGDSQADAQDGQPDANGQDGQAQGKLSSAKEQPGQGGSGAGSQDGSKEVKEAAQLKAMGKISEIIGQRSATVSGETTVEVQSGTQKLRTDYSNTAAAHVETDGDVTRDEIPLSVQAYVQQYFAEVRKSGTTQKQKSDSKAAPPKARP